DGGGGLGQRSAPDQAVPRRAGPHARAVRGRGPDRRRKTRPGAGAERRGHGPGGRVRHTGVDAPGFRAAGRRVPAHLPAAVPVHFPWLKRWEIRLFSHSPSRLSRWLGWIMGAPEGIDWSWAVATGGALSRRQRRQLLTPLLRTVLSYSAGRARL